MPCCVYFQSVDKVVFSGGSRISSQGGGAHLKKLRRTEGGAKILGVFRVKNHDFTQKNHIFSNFRGGARSGCAPPGSAPGISLFSLVISVNIFWAEIYWGRHFLGQNELKLSPLSKLGYAIFFQVKTTTHFIRLTPVKLFIGCFFFFVQLNNYISNLS